MSEHSEVRMHPFELPEFYMPYPARLNPYLRRAREHSKAWAYEVGILNRDGASVWDEKTFDIMDFALFAAQTHPDAPGEALDTLTDWYIWGWFVDDYFPHAYGEGQFEHVRATELPALLDHLEADAETRAAVDAYVGQLQDVMAGVLDGHQAIGRWRDETPSALQSAATRRGRPGLRTPQGLHSAPRSPRDRAPAPPDSPAQEGPTLPALTGLGTAAARLFQASARRPTP